MEKPFAPPRALRTIPVEKISALRAEIREWERIERELRVLTGFTKIAEEIDAMPT